MSGTFSLVISTLKSWARKKCRRLALPEDDDEVKIVCPTKGIDDDISECEDLEADEEEDHNEDSNEDDE